MKKITTLALGTALTLSMASTAFAGGPVVVEEEPEPIMAPATGSSAGIGALPLLGGVAAAVVVAAVASGGDDDDSSATTE
ncbi:hypothetical protein Ga0609869_000700 [Rhodovulum iodosum]|uniref:Ferrochelatase n=1 Tax=Rhodovulum iodosum TaxID=68291 RepID=A0ABV3XSC5_9RHOB|nr:hypothetical protein [Rhodovulum robiginosum]RSK31373.1 hypothetical protein EJA01_14595 [Rhodovulum robiginosum]